VKWQKQIEVMELPYYFRTTLSDLPLAEEYICLPDEVRMGAAQAMGLSGLPRVGLVWAAGKWNPARSVPFAQFARLLDIEACEFWNLQGGAEHEAWKAVPPEPRMRDAEECGDGLLTLAAVIGEMDLVITVDTLAAHLAGAMGKPAWVLLQHTADWRWMKDRSESAWYPSLRLFRQPAQDDWGWLIARVHDELQCYLNTSIQRKNPQ
jgi:ADP-heptose:LPS heptosyltransferase